MVKPLLSATRFYYFSGIWDRSESEVFQDIAVKSGVPPENIILEKEATNTGENVQFSQRRLEQLDIKLDSIILVQMPVMERRTYATFMKQWRGASELSSVAVTSPPMGLKEFPIEEVGDMKHTINLLVECMDRIVSYPAKGFQIPQEIPESVKSAHQVLSRWSAEV